MNKNPSYEEDRSDCGSYGAIEIGRPGEFFDIVAPGKDRGGE
jgi:hypothetical protein